MAAASWKGAVALGPIIRFNVRAAAVDSKTLFAMNMHHSADGGRLRGQLMICEACGNEVEKEDVVKGYKGAYPVDTEYLDSLALEKSSVLQIDGLVPASQIEPRWYQREYDVIPEKGAEEAYVLFTTLLERNGRVAMGKVVMSKKETIVTLRPRDGLLAMDLMWWPDEVKSDQSARSIVEGVTVSEAMLKIGDQLVKMMSKDFDPTQYSNEHAELVGAYYDSLLAGVAPEPVVHRAAPKTSESLEDALAATLAALQGTVEEKVAKATGKKKAKVA
jgi:DNA end-binding protein Ku